MVVRKSKPRLLDQLRTLLSNLETTLAEYKSSPQPQPRVVTEILGLRKRADSLAKRFKSTDTQTKYDQIVSGLFRDPRTGHKLPRDPLKAETILLSPPAIFIRKYIPRTGPNAGVPQTVFSPTPQHIVEEYIETRVKSSIIEIGSRQSPCNGNGYIHVNRDASITEALLAAAESYRDAATTGLQGDAPPPWEGRATVNGACAGFVSVVLQAVSQDPRPGVVRRIVSSLMETRGLVLRGEATVSWRRVVINLNQRGDRGLSKYILVGREDVVVELGEPILSADDLGRLGV